MRIKSLFIIIILFILVYSFPAPANLNYTYYMECILSTIFFFLIFFFEISYIRSLIYILIIDHVVPIIFLCIPFCYGIYNPFSLNTILLICTTLLIHIFLVVPLLFLLSRHRSWSLDYYSPTMSLISWANPLIYLYSAIALFYPFFWGLYASFARYLRLDNTLPITTLIDFVGIDVIAYTIASLPLLCSLCLPFLTLFMKVRLRLWDYTMVILYSVHVHFLRFNVYFKVCERLYKAYYFIFTLLLGVDRIHPYNRTIKPLFFQRCCMFLFHRPYILLIISFSIIFLEVLCTSQLFLSFYILFWVPIVFSIIRCVYLAYCDHFVTTVCIADYISQNFDNPRYPHMFWVYMESPEYAFGFTLNISQEQLIKYANISAKAHEHFNKFYGFNATRKLRDRVHGYKVTYRSGTKPQAIYCYTLRPWYTRLKADFRSSGIRWFHSSSRLLSPNTTLVSNNSKNFIIELFLMSKDPVARLALLNRDVDFSVVEKAPQPIFPSASTLFTVHDYVIIKSKLRSLIDVTEVASVINNRAR